VISLLASDFFGDAAGLKIFFAGLHEPVQNAVFEFGVAFTHGNQFGKLIVALFEDDVDIRPGFFDVFLQGDQAVVNHDEIAGDRQYSEQKQS